MALPMNGNISYNNEIIHNQLNPAHTSHGVITISSNAEFNSTADAEGWAGNGTIENPFIITGYSINAGGTDPCISITDTTVHFMINDTIATGSIQYTAGIKFDNVTNGYIHNVTSTGNGYGFQIVNSDNCTLTRNHALANNVFGIRTVYSTNLSLYENVLESNGFDFEGDDITDWPSELDGTNTVNGKSVGYYLNVTGSGGDTTGDYGQIIIAFSENLTVRGYNISLTTISYVAWYSNNISFIDNIALKNAHLPGVVMTGGIYLMHCTDCVIIGNQIDFNRLGNTAAYSDH